MKGNDFVALMLRSPLHRLMANTMLITVTGRRSGRSITTPVNFSCSDETLWILTSRSRKWWRNISPGSPVRLHLDGRDIDGIADLILDESAVATQLADYVRQIPGAARALGLTIVNGIPDRQAAMRLACDRLFVRVCLPQAIP